MKVIENTAGFSHAQRRCVATIGKFDGVHRGHQLILSQLKARGGELTLPTVVILIEPHPEEFFAPAPQKAPARLMEFEEKLELLEKEGVDYVYRLSFNTELSQLSAEDYIREILVSGLHIACLIVGSDFRFGHQRRGDFAMLQRFGKAHDFEVVESASCILEGVRVSSTRIRQELEQGNFPFVERLLGRPYSISGRVVRGQRLGRELGFPTCNVRLSRSRLPLHGVYACEVLLEEGAAGSTARAREGVANIGYRPTVSDTGEAVLEVHLFDFDRNLYDRLIRVRFLCRIRGEEKFSSLEELRERIAQDVTEARQFFERRPGRAGEELQKHHQ